MGKEFSREECEELNASIRRMIRLLDPYCTADSLQELGLLGTVEEEDEEAESESGDDAEENNAIIKPLEMKTLAAAAAPATNNSVVVQEVAVDIGGVVAVEIESMNQ